MRKVQILLLIAFSISLSACADKSISESEAVVIASNWAEQRNVFDEPPDGWMPILRKNDVVSNDNYIIVMFKYDVPIELDGADYGLHVIFEKNSGKVVYVGGPSAHIFDEHFPRNVDFGPYYEGVFAN